jgi:hypothetical protein
MIGISRSPASVRAYSTRGGTSGWTVRLITPASSRARNSRVSICWEIPPLARRSALKRIGPLLR